VALIVTLVIATAVHIPANYFLTDMLVQVLANVRLTFAVRMDIAQISLLDLLAVVQETVIPVTVIPDQILVSRFLTDTDAQTLANVSPTSAVQMDIVQINL
jgi:hypothetical protein